MRYGSCWGVDLYESGDRKLIRNRRDQCRSPNGDDTSNECCRQISWQLQRNSLCFPENHCAHSSKAAGSPCRCARTSPAIASLSGIGATNAEVRMATTHLTNV